jgi:hypothetical protein
MEKINQTRRDQPPKAIHYKYNGGKDTPESPWLSEEAKNFLEFLQAVLEIIVAIMTISALIG